MKYFEKYLMHEVHEKLCVYMRNNVIGIVKGQRYECTSKGQLEDRHIDN